jgi:hypothetical protein
MQATGTVLKRRILFKKSKPFIRRFELSDMWILWAAYKEGSFPVMPEGMEKEAFYTEIRQRLNSYHQLMLVEDDCKKFKDGRGPVCLIGARTDGWKIEPHVEFFKWASKQNILRVNVRFFNWIRQNKEIGVCIVRSLKHTTNLFHHVREYGVLNFVGKIPGGDSRGDEYIFSIRGKKIDGFIKAKDRIQRDGKSADTTGATTDTSEQRSDSNSG